MTTVNPDDLRFTQDSIACHFQAPHEHVRIRDAVEKIQTGQMCPDDFPKIRVISYGGSLWSIDNRRLWVFRKAKCSQITVKSMNRMHYRLDELTKDPSKYKRFSKAEFLPRIRRAPNASPVPTVSYEGLRPESLNARAHMASLSSSFSGAPSGRQDDAVTMKQPTKEPSVDIECSIYRHTETESPQSLPEEKTLYEILHVSQSTHDDGRPTESWREWVRELARRWSFGCW